MREIEMKILEIDKEAVLKKLRALGAEKIYEAFIRVKYFDYPDHRIHKASDLLRLRELQFKNGKIKTEAVYKINRGVKKGCKIFDELEFQLAGKNSFESLTKYLKKFGIRQTLYYEKIRTLFKYKNLKFELDEHPKIPPLLEIEAKSEKEIYKAIKMLGLGKYEKSPETIGILMKRKYPKIRLNRLKFDKRGKFSTIKSMYGGRY